MTPKAAALAVHPELTRSWQPGITRSASSWNDPQVTHLSGFLSIDVLVIVSTVKVAAILLPVVFHNRSHTRELLSLAPVFVSQDA
jgi:hypothetical protein